MASRLIERLDAAIVNADDPITRECLKAERAGALARHGKFVDARFALGGLRTQSQRRKNVLLSAWVALVDGQIEHFEAIAPKAREKFQRAFELAQSIDHAPMQALASAWLANCAVNSADLDAVKRHVINTLRLVDRDAHATLARISLALADAYRRVGEDATSQDWYLRARAHASMEGDPTMISAFLYNISTRRADQIGLDDAFGRSDEALASRALLEAESAGNYDAGSDVSSLSSMVPMIRAQLLVALKRYPEALALFDQQLDRSLQEGWSHRDARLLATRAWCCLHTGDARLDGDLQFAEARAHLQDDSDDRAVAFARIACIYRSMGQESLANSFQMKAEQELSQYQSEREALRATLAAALLEVDRKDIWM